MLAPQSAELSANGEPVRLIQLRGGLGAVPGICMTGVHAGIKKRKSDLALIALPGPHVCAEVITTNEIKAAPLLVTSAHLATDGDAIAAIVCNSGCANACTPVMQMPGTAPKPPRSWIRRTGSPFAESSADCGASIETCLLRESE